MTLGTRCAKQYIGLLISSLNRCLRLALLLAVGCGTPVAKASSSNSQWAAQWIGPGESGTNLWTCYRKTFLLDSVPTTAPARIAVDSKYWLWVNGRFVEREGGLKRGPTPTSAYFDALDLAPHLVKGSNTLALLVWYFGKSGFSHNSSGEPGMVFEMKLGKKSLTSDASWKILAHPAFGTASGPLPNYRLPESSLRFDARRDLPGWMLPAFDDSSWDSPKLKGTPPTDPWGSLEQRPIPFWKDYGLKEYVHTEILGDNTNGTRTISAKLPYNAQVLPYFKIEAPAGLTIDLRTDDFMGGSAANVHAEYVTRSGEQEFEAFGWMNGHEVHYLMPAGVKVLALKYRETGFDTEFAGAFTCEDPFYNELWQKARRTLYITMRDNYMDCPDRERAQWWGDAANELGEVFYAFDPSAYSLSRKAILNLACWQRADKSLYAPVPSGRPAADSVRKDQGDGNWNAELPAQMLASVGQYGFWTYYLYTGDKTTIAAVYPQVRDYLRLWRQDPDGLVIHRPGDWDWEDWGENIDAPVLDSAWYYLALKGAVGMAQVGHCSGEVGEWQLRMRAIERGFNAKFWNGTEYRSPGYQGDTDDRANALAVVAGLAKPDQFPAIRSLLAAHHNASPYMEKYVLESLFMMAAPEEALARMKQRYQTQVASPLTTLWEGWGIGTDGYGGGTYNHAWSGGPLTVLSRYAAGIAPTEPGYASYQVLPQLGTLRKIQAVIPTVRGQILVAIARTDETFSLELQSPSGTPGLVGVPQTASRRVTNLKINGLEVDFRKHAKAKGIKFIGEDDHYCRFLVDSGSWKFDAAYSTASN
jgi:hypothetical protein